MLPAEPLFLALTVLVTEDALPFHGFIFVLTLFLVVIITPLFFLAIDFICFACKWEKGLCYPDINNLINISDYFNVSIDTLVNNEIQTSKNKNIKKKSFFKILKYTTPYLLIFILIKLNK